jgi:hypothetical protein
MTLAERPRTENERRVADLAATCDELREVEPARPLTDSNPDRASRCNSSEWPSGGYGGSEHDVLRADRAVFCSCAENLKGYLGARRPEDEPGEVSGGVALCGKAASTVGRLVGSSRSARPSGSSTLAARGLPPDTKT